MITPPCAWAICCRSRANLVKYWVNSAGNWLWIQTRRGFSVVCWTGAAHVLSLQLIPMLTANMGVYRQTSSTAKSFRQLVKSSSTRFFRPFFHLACIGRFRCSQWPSSATWWPKQQQWLRRSAVRASVDLQTWFSTLGHGGKYVVQKRETKAINKLCVREIRSLSFVCVELPFLEFCGRNLVCFGTAYNFDRGRHWQIRAGGRKGTHACCAFHACRRQINLAPRVYSAFKMALSRH